MPGLISSVVLYAAGMAGVVMPRKMALFLGQSLQSARGVAEYRVANAGFAGLGAWAMIDRSAGAVLAVAAVWLAAAAARVLMLAIDRPKADSSYWGFLALEVAAGVAALLSVRGA